MRHEDHSLRFMAASDSLPTECLERAGFHYRHDRVRKQGDYQSLERTERANFQILTPKREPLDGSIF